jgi:hypothetical protein
LIVRQIFSGTAGDFRGASERAAAYGRECASYASFIEGRTHWPHHATSDTTVISTRY